MCFETILKYVENELMAPVIPLLLWVVVMPLAIVNRDLHLLWVTIVQAVATSEVLATVKVLRIINIRVVLETIEIARSLVVTPCLPVGLRLLCRSC